MKVSLNLMQFMADTYGGGIKLAPKGVDELVEKIGAQLGAVEEVVDVGKKYQGIVVAKVVSCEKHPDADKLSICKIDDGKKVKAVKRDEKGLVQVVCGAPNVKAGMLVAWLPPGSVVPATIDKDPLKLEAREIRGVVSNGMLASASEVGISDDHTGILEIDQSSKPGDDFAQIYRLDDHIIDIENKMFTHRPDLFGHLGVSREIAGITNRKFTSPDWYLREPKFETASGLGLKVKVEDSKLVPRFMAVAIKDVEVAPSPIWLQALLNNLGIRPINNIVDLTNYFMIETAQPLHAYDYDKVKALSGDTPTLMARQSKKGEKIKLLNGKTIELEDGDIVIATDKEAIGIGGVMGGADTEVDENTQNIILESANFDMYSIRRTAMKYGLFTDAVTRFTKNQSSLQNDRVLAKNMAEIEKLAGGQQASPVHDVKKNLNQPGAVRVSDDFINQRLGLKLTPKKIAELLVNVEFKVLTLGRGQLGITPPFWRTDIEIAEDIVEEVGRLYGYDHLPIELPKRTIKPAKRNELLDFKTRLRDVLSKAGANEVLTYSFVHGNLLENVGHDKNKAYELSNALSPELQYYRMSLTPSLLSKVHPNIKSGIGEFALFEIGKAHIKGLMDEAEKDIPAEEERVGLVFAASDKMAAGNYSGAVYYQALRYMDELLANLKIEYTLEAIDHEPHLEEGQQLVKPFDLERSSYVRVNDELVGVIGEIRFEVRNTLKLPSFTAALELDINRLVKKQGSQKAYTPIPRYPKVSQDISLKFDNDTPNEAIHDFFNSEVKELRAQSYFADWDYLDIYKDEKSSKKHVAFRLAVASYERTLTDKEVNKLLDDIAERAKEKFEAERI